MKTILPAFCLLFAACFTTKVVPDYGRPLPPGADALLPLGPHEKRPVLGATWQHRNDVLPALERSIQWTGLRYAEQFFPICGITHDHALRSLTRFRELLQDATGPVQFHEAVYQEFDVFKSAGWDAKGGGVLFTGYCTPILEGSRTPDATYRYPLYSQPDDLEKGEKGSILGQRTPAGLRPYPTRRAIEAGGLLEGKGLELVYLKNPIDAFIAHVNGSAFVRLPDQSMFKLGYAAKNGREYSSLGRALVADEHLTEEEVSLGTIRAWAADHPELVEDYLHQNDSYVFFTPIDGNPRGSLNVEVTRELTLATDKTLFPRGALVFVDAMLPSVRGGVRPFRQLMLDQDTGGAIRTAGRADIYLGVGPDAERLAGMTRAEGQLYYFFLKR